MAALEKPHAAKDIREAQKAIPDEILAVMVKECSGDQSQILKKAQEYIKDNQQEIILAKYYAVKGLRRAAKLLDRAKRDNEKILFDVEKIIDYATELKNIIPAIPNFDDLSEIDELSLPMHLADYIYSSDRKEFQRFGDCESKEVLEKLKDWNEFLYLLETRIEIFKNIQAKLSFLKRKGAPNKVVMLTGFIHQMAKMYTVSTGKKFKVSEYDGSSHYTEGMRFAQKAMATLFLANSKGYTRNNFHSACKRAAATENKLKSNKRKMP